MDRDEHEFPRRAPRETQPPIDLDDGADIANWCTRLRTCEDDLRKAIASVGAMPAAVAFFLNGRTT